YTLAILFSRLPRPQRLSLSPYTTLFRSQLQDQPHERRRGAAELQRRQAVQAPLPGLHKPAAFQVLAQHHAEVRGRRGIVQAAGRSEEHTSELQSRENLVCRLLLEKKK